MRFWFLEYYEDFDLPDEERYSRVRKWRAACLEHPAAQQVTKEQIVKVYYDYAKGGERSAAPGTKALVVCQSRSTTALRVPPKSRWLA